MQTFYRRPLPDTQIAFSSDEGRALFREALLAQTAESFFALSEQFHTQSEPAFCGLGTLVVILNALSIDPGRIWKGSWRWFSEELLDCCYPLEAIQKEGTNFHQFSCLARCNGADVSARRASDASLDMFRQDLLGACRSASGPFVAVAYSRKALSQTGDGHYSPIAAYHEARDLVLVLDVARFKYPPHWVSVSSLFDAMLPVDASTQKSRGYFLLSRSRAPVALCFQLHNSGYDWRTISQTLLREVPSRIEAQRPQTVTEALSVWLGVMTPELLSMVDVTEPQEKLMEAILLSVEGLPLFSLVKSLPRASAGMGWSPSTLVLTVLLLVVGERVFSRLSESLRRELAALYQPNLEEPLNEEIERLREQFSLLEEWGSAPG